MRAFAFALAISLAAGSAEAATPRRVASLNLCTDELLLVLGAPGQIVSVTHLAHIRAETPLWRQARRYRKNDGSLVSVAPMQPDLVLTMGGGVRDRSRIGARLGIRTLDIPYPQRIADVEASIRTVSEALGRRGAGERVIAQIAALKRTAPRDVTEALWLGGGGRTLAATGLGAEWMSLAGFRQRPTQGDRVSLEELLVRPPRAIIRSDYRSGQYSSEQRWLSHPLARAAGKSRTFVSDGRRWTCMGPLMAAETLRLRAERAR